MLFLRFRSLTAPNLHARRPQRISRPSLRHQCRWSCLSRRCLHRRPPSRRRLLESDLHSVSCIEAEVLCGRSRISPALRFLVSPGSSSRCICCSLALLLQPTLGPDRLHVAPGLWQSRPDCTRGASASLIRTDIRV